MKPAFLLPALLFPLLLPSCVTSNIGRSIREAGEIHHSANFRTPVGGVIHQTPTQRHTEHTAYVLAPEVTYRIYSGTIVLHGLKDNTPPWPVAYDFCPTGQNKLVFAECADKHKGMHPTRFIRLADSLPAHARAYATNVEFHEPCYAGIVGDTRPATKAPLWRHALALPFDCLIDPALSVVLTAGYWAEQLVIDLPLTILGDLVEKQPASSSQP